MIDSTNSVGALVASILGERRPELVERPAQARDAPSRAPRQVRVPTAQELDQLVRERARTAVSGDLPSGLRARRALAAYASMEQIDEREYVARVLGVDERV